MYRGMKDKLLGVLVIVLLILGSTVCYGQPVVRLAGQDVYLEENVGQVGRSRGAVGRVAELGLATGGYYNVLMQLHSIPDGSARSSLSEAGVELGDYVGGNAYWARIRSDVDVYGSLGEHGVRSVVGVEPAWKLSRALEEDDIPTWARVGGNGVRVSFFFAPNASQALVQSTLTRLEASEVAVSEELGYGRAVLPRTAVLDFASEPWVLVVEEGKRPYELENRQGRELSRVNVLEIPGSLGGRGLDGTGMTMGIWDGNVVQHPDFGDRVHQQEYEYPGVGAEHGTHVLGTVLGAGMINPDARGMAPKAVGYTYNFNVSSNGLLEEIEMLDAYRQFGISLTQNSYGRSMDCDDYYDYHYSNDDMINDVLHAESLAPRLLQVFSAGNEQIQCPDITEPIYGVANYGSGTKRTKNTLLVGAVRSDGTMSHFSSWGPMDDGRMLATVCTKGNKVLSLAPGGGTDILSGTSMSCPMASGSILLMMQRYAQLNDGAAMRSDLARTIVANSARDVGRPGPDYQFGFGMLDVERAVEVVEGGQYVMGMLKSGNVAGDALKISVPAGVSSVKVMLGWNDVAVKKAYRYGERVQAHDLDLTVDGHGPLALHPDDVTALASEGRDSLNNLEQCVIETNGLARELDVRVRPYRGELAYGSQRYVVTWIFEYVRLRVVAPGYGQYVEPRGSFYLRHEGLHEGGVAEVSYDNGKSYTFLSRLVAGDPRMPETENILLTLPDDAKFTAQARIRIVTSGGRIAVSEAFTVGPKVQGVKFNQTLGCDASAGWALKWDEAAGAEYGYEIVRGDAVSQVWESVGHVAKGVTSFTVPAEECKGGAIYAVCARLDDKGTLGQRSIGVYANLPAKPEVDPLNMPYEESFEDPDRLVFTYKAGVRDHMHFMYGDVIPGFFAPGSNMIKIATNGAKKVIDDPADEYYNPKPLDFANPFAHEGHVSRLSMCEFDLSAFAGKKLMMSVIWGHTEMERIGGFVAYRLKHGDKVIPDQNGETMHTSSGITERIYILDGGTKEPLILEAVCSGAHASLKIVGIKMSVLREGPDVFVSLKEYPKAGGVDMGVERVSVEVTNISGTSVKDAQVEVLLNGKVVAVQPLRELVSGRKASFNFDVDFSVPDPLGILHELEVRCPVAGDLTPRNNRKVRTVNNRGKVYPLEDGKFDGLLAQSVIPRDPQKVVTLPATGLAFTDGGGVYGPIRNAVNISTVRFLPSDRNKVVRARVVYFDNSAGAGELRYSPDNALYNEEGDMTINESVFSRVFRGRLEDVPVEIVSVADDGGITFRATTKDGGDGWLIYLDEVPRSRGLEIVAWDGMAQGDLPEGQVPVRVRIKNHLQSPVYDVRVNYETGVGDFSKVHTVVIDSIGGGDTTAWVTIDAVRLKQTLVKDLRVWVDHWCAGDPSNSRVYGAVAYDRYPVPKFVPGVGVEGADPYRDLSLPGIGYRDQRIAFKEWRSAEHSGQRIGLRGAVQYVLGDTLEVYRSDWGSAYLELDKGTTLRKGVSVALFVDWNNDLSFDTVDRVDGWSVSAYGLGDKGRLRLRGLDASTEIGSYRARLILSSANEVGDPSCAKLKHGYVRDFVIRVVDHNPFQNDIRLNSLAFLDGEGKRLKDHVFIDDLPSGGLKLVAYVSSSELYGGRLSFRVKRSDGSEEVLQRTLPLGEKLLVGHGNELAVVLYESIDVSHPGLLSYEVEVQDLGASLCDLENNAGQIELGLLRPSTGGSYALSFKSLHDAEKGDKVELPGISPYAAHDGHWTLEFWCFPDGTQNSTIVNRHGGLRIGTTENMEYSGVKIPDDAFYFEVKNLVFHTGAGTVKPGRWNHVALMHKSTGSFILDASEVSVYINGKKQDVTVLKKGYYKDFSQLTLGKSFNGLIDEVRLWRRVVHEDTLNKFMYSHIPGDLLNDSTKLRDLLFSVSLDEGPWNMILGSVESFERTKKDHHYEGRIEPGSAGRLDDALRGGLWYNLKEQPQLGALTFNGMFEYHYDREEGAYVLSFLKETDLSQVKGEIVGVWPGSVVEVDGAAFEPNTTVLDFSDGKRVAVTIKREVWGVDFSETIELLARGSEAEGSDLLNVTLWAAENEGLAKDINVVVEGNAVEIDLESALKDMSHVHVGFKASDGAQVYFGNRRLTSPAVLSFNEQPVVLRVVSSSGRSVSHYSLGLRMGQRIEWSVSKLAYDYDTCVIKLDGRSSSGLPLRYRVSDGSVATVRGDSALHLLGTGEVDVYAYQDGNSQYRAAEPVSHRFTVGTRAVKVRPAVSSLSFGSSVDWQFAYDGLVYSRDRYFLPDPYAKVGWQFVDKEGRVYKSDALLPIGTYQLKPIRESAYPAGSYVITPEGVDVTVTGSPSLTQVVFRVTKDDGLTPIEGAYVAIGNVAGVSDAKGELMKGFKQGGRYAYEAHAPGYEVVRGVLVTEEMSQVEVISLREAKYTVTYGVSDPSQGWVVGSLVQHVSEGGSTEPVYASAMDGYELSEWSDGVKEAQRNEVNVRKNQEIVARFAAKSYPVHYVVGEGGRFVDATYAEQSLKAGEAGVEVEVEPVEAEYYFIGWSDGKSESSRIDEGTGGEQTYKAYFGQVQTLPYLENFEGAVGDLPLGWMSTTTYQDPVVDAHVASGITILGVDPVWDMRIRFMRGNYLLINSTPARESGDVVVLTPRYRLSDSEEKVYFGFDWVMGRAGDGMNGYYRFRNGSKVSDYQAIDTISKFFNQFRLQEFRWDLSVPAEYRGGTLEFKFTYHAERGKMGFAFDDFRVYQSTQGTGLTITYRVYPEDGGMIRFDPSEYEDEEAYKNETEQRTRTSYVRNGEMGDYNLPFKAEPDAGRADRKFLYWSYGDGRVITYDRVLPLLPLGGESVEYVAHFAADSYEVKYGVHPENGGKVVRVSDGEGMSSEFVSAGGSGSEVEARAAAGYRFVRWVDDGSVVAKRQVKGVNESLFISALFERTDIGTLQVGATHEYVSEGKTIAGPSAGALVYVFRDGKLVVTGVTDAGGAYRVRLEAGEYVVRVTYGPCNPEECMVVVRSGESVGIQVKLGTGEPVYQVRFKVTDENGVAMTGARISVNDRVWVTDAFGYCDAYLPYGFMSWEVTKEGYSSANGVWTVVRDYQEIGVKLRGGTHRVELVFYLSQNESAPAPGVVVIVGGHRGVTDGEGRVFFDLDAGTYGMGVQGQGYEPQQIIEGLTVKGEAVERYVYHVTQVRYVARIRVVDAQNAEVVIPNARLRMLDRVPNRGFDRTVMTGEDGVAVWNLPVGQYTCCISVPGSDVYDSVVFNHFEIMGLDVELQFALPHLIPQFNALDANSLSGIEVSPNPAVGYVRIDGVEGAYRVELLSLAGHVLSVEEVRGRESVYVSLEGLRSGVYLLRVVGADGYAIRRVVKQ